MLVSRFILHLQSASIRAVYTNSSQALTASNGSSIIFERVIGSLAASIAPDEYLEREDSSADIDYGERSGEESASRD